MKSIKPKIKVMNLKEKLFYYLNRFEQIRRKEVNDYGKEIRKDNLLYHTMKQQRSENLYIIICTLLYTLILFGFCVVFFLLACNLLIKILL